MDSCHTWKLERSCWGRVPCFILDPSCCPNLWHQWMTERITSQRGSASWNWFLSSQDSFLFSLCLLQMKNPFICATTDQRGYLVTKPTFCPETRVLPLCFNIRRCLGFFVVAVLFSNEAPVKGFHLQMFLYTFLALKAGQNNLRY